MVAANAAKDFEFLHMVLCMVVKYEHVQDVIRSSFVVYVCVDFIFDYSEIVVFRCFQ